MTISKLGIKSTSTQVLQKQPIHPTQQQLYKQQQHQQQKQEHHHCGPLHTGYSGKAQKDLQRPKVYKYISRHQHSRTLW